MPDYNVIDTTPVISGGYFKVIFIRTEELKSDISIFKWCKLIIFEIIFADEILESMVINASVASVGGHLVIKDHGKLMHLSRYIPAGVLSNYFRLQLLEVLYFKYYLRYKILAPEEHPQKSELEGKFVIDCSRIRFCLDKKYLEQFISFRRVYDTSWLIMNLLIDFVVYLLSNDIKLAIISALVVGFLRRLVKL